MHDYKNSVQKSVNNKYKQINLTKMKKSILISALIALAFSVNAQQYAMRQMPAERPIQKAVAEDGEAEEIFCDDESRFQMMQRVLKGRMLPLLVIFFATLLPQFLINLLSTHNYFIASFIGGILAMYIAIFVMCFVKYNQYKNKK